METENPLEQDTELSEEPGSMKTSRFGLVTLTPELNAKLDKINNIIIKHEKSIKLLKNLKNSLILKERTQAHNDDA